MAVNVYLAATNVLGWPALVKARGMEKIIVGSIMMASTMMHISETKHTLVPPLSCLRDISNILLNIDRLVTYTTGPYFFYKFWRLYRPAENWKSPHQESVVWIFIVGALALRLGEYPVKGRLFNYLIYPFLHTIWHACVYYLIYHLLG